VHSVCTSVCTDHSRLVQCSCARASVEDAQNKALRKYCVHRCIFDARTGILSEPTHCVHKCLHRPQQACAVLLRAHLHPGRTKQGSRKYCVHRCIFDARAGILSEPTHSVHSVCTSVCTDHSRLAQCSYARASVQDAQNRALRRYCVHRCIFDACAGILSEPTHSVHSVCTSVCTDHSRLAQCSCTRASVQDAQNRALGKYCVHRCIFDACTGILSEPTHHAHEQNLKITFQGSD
jgi:hypothetical protein